MCGTYASSFFHGQSEKLGSMIFFAGQITHCQIEKLQSQREVTVMTPDICISYQKCNNYHEKNGQ